MKIRLTSIKDIEGFCKMLDKCKGTVNITTPEGDVLNLKSKFSQLVTINVILSGLSELNNIELFVENETEASLLMKYIGK